MYVPYNRPRALDLFTGIGGGVISAEACGWETAAFSEILPFQNAQLAKHWPDVPNLGDIRAITEDVLTDLGPLDLVTGGAPCQPASLAGKRGGDSDDRWLWDEFIRVVRLARPRWLCGENPIGIHSLNDGSALRTVVGDFAALGYSLLWVRFPAEAVGAPHERQRIFIIGYQEETMADDHSLGREGRSRQQWSEGWAQFEDGREPAHEGQRERGAGSAEPGLGSELLRLPGRVAEYQERARRIILTHRWPADMDQPQRNHEFPFTSRSGIERSDKLVSLGNCVVPQQQYMVLKAIWDMDPNKAEW